MADIQEWTPESHEWLPDEKGGETDSIYNLPENVISPNTGFSGIGLDAISKFVGYPFALAEGLKNLPSEALGGASQITTDIPRFSKNILSGFGEIGNKILSAPGATRDYLVEKELLGKNSPSFRLPESILPRDFNYSEAVGINDHKPGDELIKSIPEQLLLAPLFNKIYPHVSEIPLSKGVGGKKLNAVREEIGERGVKKLDVDKNLIKDAQQYLPKDSASKKLLQRARNGEYDALFTLQSDLRKRGTSFKRSLSGADRQHGFDAHDLRAKILNEIKGDLRTKGHSDLADLMHLGQKRYAQHMKFRKPAIGLAALAIGHNKLGDIYNLIRPK